jgi:hypothetical protein
VALPRNPDLSPGRPPADSAAEWLPWAGISPSPYSPAPAAGKAVLAVSALAKLAGDLADLLTRMGSDLDRLEARRLPAREEGIDLSADIREE